MQEDVLLNIITCRKAETHNSYSLLSHDVSTGCLPGKQRAILQMRTIRSMERRRMNIFFYYVTYCLSSPKVLEKWIRLKENGFHVRSYTVSYGMAGCFFAYIHRLSRTSDLPQCDADMTTWLQRLCYRNRARFPTTAPLGPLGADVASSKASRTTYLTQPFRHPK